MAFEDRLVEHPGRVVLTPVAGATDTYDVDYTSAEGEVTQEGTLLNADSMNSAVQDLIDSAMDAFTISDNGTVRVKNIQIGVVSITPTAANTTTSKAFTFTEAFENVPVVMVLPRSRAPQEITTYAVHDISTTGFTLYMRRTNRTQTQFMYLAVGA
jgi:hypothetical protein